MQHENTSEDLRKRVLSLLQMINCRRQEIDEIRRLISQREKFVIEEESENVILESLDLLEERILSEKSYLRCSEKALQSMQLSHLIRSLLGLSPSTKEGPFDVSKQEKVAKMITENKELFLSHSILDQEIKKMQAKIEMQQKESRDIMCKARELKAQLDKIKTEEGESLQEGSTTVEHEQLQENIKAITIIKAVFQELIIGSGVDWELDPKLKDYMMELGRTYKP